MRRIFPFSLLFCLLLLAACKDEPKNEDGGDEILTAPTRRPTISLRTEADTARWRDTLVSEIEKSDLPGADSSKLARVEFAYPLVDATPSAAAVKDSINALIRRTLLLADNGEIAYENLQARINDFLDEYITQRDEMAEIYRSMGMDIIDLPRWSCEVNVRIVLNSSNFLVLQFDETNFTGGAHANVTTRFFNFDLRTGEILTIEQLFKDKEGYYGQLQPLVERSLRQHLRSLGAENLEIEIDEGAFARIPEHFALTRTGLRFSLDPYEVGAFSMGTLQFEVPFEDLYYILDRDKVK